MKVSKLLEADYVYRNPDQFRTELADILKIPATQIVSFAFKHLGLMVTINQRMDFDQIELIAGEFGLAGSEVTSSGVNAPAADLTAMTVCPPTDVVLNSSLYMTGRVTSLRSEPLASVKLTVICHGLSGRADRLALRPSETLLKTKPGPPLRQ